MRKNPICNSFTQQNVTIKRWVHRATPFCGKTLVTDLDFKNSSSFLKHYKIIREMIMKESKIWVAHIMISELLCQCLFSLLWPRLQFLSPKTWFCPSPCRSFGPKPPFSMFASSYALVLTLVCSHVFCYASLVSEFGGLQNLLEGGKGFQRGPLSIWSQRHRGMKG